ncbi:MAG: alpha/beta hydrolase [Mycobacteriaceae bacterium]
MSLSQSTGRAAPDVRTAAALARIPAGFRLWLPGRGVTYITDTAGPEGAPTLILLHGAGCTGLLNWFTSIDALSQHFRVITMDQRNHGGGISTTRFSLYDCADDVACLVETMALGKVIVLGHSMGSVVAQRVWRQHPETLAGLVLCSTTDRFRSSRVESVVFSMFHASVVASRLLPDSRSTASLGTAKLVLPTQYEPEATTAWMRSEWRKSKPLGGAQVIAACGRHHSTPWISRIDVPTAVVVTAKDRVFEPQRQRQLAERIPGATIHEVDGGHAAPITDADVFVPVAVAAAVETAQRAGYPITLPSAD